MKKLRLIGLSCLVALLAGCAATGPAPVSDRPPMEGAAPTPAAPRPGYYVIKQGDTLNAVSRQFGVPVADLISWNDLPNPNQLEVGQEVRVIPPGATASASGVQVHPIAPNGVEVHPVAPASAEAPQPVLKTAPKAGKVPYSDQAWAQAQAGNAPAQVNPGTAAAKPEATPTPPAAANANTEWVWPAQGKIIATFNDSTNKGIDIAGTPGDPILAAKAGKVVYAGTGLRGYGKLVIIKHDDNFLSAYAHNQKLLVSEGQSVTKGQQIAELGSSESDRPKLHFEIRKQGKPVDPLKYLPKR